MLCLAHQLFHILRVCERADTLFAPVIEHGMQHVKSIFGCTYGTSYRQKAKTLNETIIKGEDV